MTEKIDKQQEDTLSEPETYQEMAEAYIKTTKNILFENAFKQAEEEGIYALQNALYHVMIYDQGAAKYQDKANKALADIAKYEKKQRKLITLGSILGGIITAGGAAVAAYFREIGLAIASGGITPFTKQVAQYFAQNSEDIQRSLESKEVLSHYQIKNDYHKEMFQEVCFFVQECGAYKDVEKNQAKIVFGNRVVDIIKAHDRASSSVKETIQKNILKDFKVKKSPKIGPAIP